MVDSMKNILESNQIPEGWEEYQKKDGFAVYTKDERGANQGAGISGIYVNAIFKQTAMLTLLGVNVEVDLLKDWVPGIDLAKFCKEISSFRRVIEIVKTLPFPFEDR